MNYNEGCGQIRFGPCVVLGRIRFKLCAVIGHVIGTFSVTDGIGYSYVPRIFRAVDRQLSGFHHYQGAPTQSFSKNM